AAIRAGYTADTAVITEPTGLEIATAQAGAITFSLTVPGRSAHAAFRREGVSAVDKLWILLGALRRDEQARNEAEDNLQMRELGLPYPTSVGRVAAGGWSSTVPDRAVVEGRYGVRLGQTPDEAEADLRRVISDACETDAWLRDHPVSLEVTGGRFASASVETSHPLP